jgi:hypothetical protein
MEFKDRPLFRCFRVGLMIDFFVINVLNLRVSKSQETSHQLSIKFPRKTLKGEVSSFSLVKLLLTYIYFYNNKRRMLLYLKLEAMLFSLSI